MADDIILSTPVGTGAKVRTLVDAGGREWQGVAAAYATHLSTDAGVTDPNSFQVITAAAGMPVQPQTGSTWAVTGTFWQATQPVSAASLPLPTGAATAANQATEITGLASILTALQGTLTVSVSALPFGLATSANQATANASLASIDAKITACNTGAVVVSASALPAGAATESTLSALNGKAPSLGQALAAGSVPVVLTAAQLTTLTPPAAVTANIGTTGGLALETGGNLATIAGKDFATQTTLAALNGKVTACNTGAVVLAASAAVIGHVVVDSGTVTVGNATLAVTQSGTWNVGTVTTVTTCSTVTSLTQLNGVAITLNKGASDAGTLRVTLGDGTQTIGALTANQSVNVAQINGIATSTGNGVSGTGVQRVTIASDSTGQVALAAGSAIIGKVTTDQTTHGTTDLVAADITKVAGAAIAQGHGTAATAIRVELPTDGTGVVGLNAGSNLVGKVGIDQTTVGTTNGVTPVPATSGGPTVARVKAASGTNATNVKASAGQVYGWYLFNNAAAIRAVHFYNSASAPTAGSGTPIFTVALPIGGGSNVEFSMGIPFGTGIGYTITTGIGDSDTGSCTADDVHGALLYK